MWRPPLDSRAKSVASETCLVTLAAALVAAMPATAGNVAVVAENPGRGLSDVARAAVLTALQAASTALGVSVLVLEPRSAPEMR